MNSCVKELGGVPSLFVNGEPVAANAYITYYAEKSRCADFAAAGCRLYSVPVYFAGITINDMGQLPPFTKGIFDEETPDFSVVDRHIRAILAACPAALIFPRVNMSLPRRWERENPDELCDFGFTENKRPCFSSEKWLEDTRGYLKIFVEHIENSDYRENIVGYQIADGNTEEWFPYDMRGSQGLRSREKCEGMSDYEEFRYYSETVAAAIITLAETVKELTGGRLVVGAFYGYTAEVTDRAMCHHALKQVLECDSVDFLCSPLSYEENRRVGIDHACMVPVDSLKLHGKLYFSENDTRTHLTHPPCDLPHYNTPVWQPRDRGESLEILKMHYSRALCHGHALWWFDMWGGWFNDAKFMGNIGDFLKITESSLAKNRGSVSEIAVFIDETAYAYISDGSDHFVYPARRALGLMGAPYDIYLTSDFEAVYKNYKCFVFVAPRVTALTENAVKAAGGAPYITVTPENADITAAEFRELLRKAGAHIYCDADSVVYASQSYVFIHTCESGRLNLNAGGELKLLVPRELDLNGEIPAYTSLLFERITDHEE